MMKSLLLAASLVGFSLHSTTAFAAEAKAEAKAESKVEGKAGAESSEAKKSSSKAAAKSSSKSEKKEDVNPVVVIKTNLGKIEVKLNSEKAPISVRNFMRYVDEKHYDGTIFHRVISGFMIQGGGYKVDMSEKDTHEPIKNEAANGLQNKKGTIAMARTGVVDSATAQFFINVVDNYRLDHRSPDPAGFGYAVFGEVTSGMDVVEKIRNVQTGSKGMYDDVPLTPVIIESVRRK